MSLYIIFGDKTTAKVATANEAKSIVEGKGVYANVNDTWHYVNKAWIEVKIIDGKAVVTNSHGPQ